MLAYLFGAFLALAQVSASQVPTSVRTEVPDPMQIEVSLGADVDTKGQARLPFDQQPLGKARAYPEVDQFVCDQARVRMLTVKKTKESADEVEIEASLTLMSEWPLQDVDLMLSLVAKDGQVVAKKSWDNLTLGAWSRSYVPPKAQIKISSARWRELFSGGSAPLLRIVVDIQD